jgi:hypothetical protein
MCAAFTDFEIKIRKKLVRAERPGRVFRCVTIAATIRRRWLAPRPFRGNSPNPTNRIRIPLQSAGLRGKL